MQVPCLQPSRLDQSAELLAPLLVGMGDLVVLVSPNHLPKAGAAAFSRKLSYEDMVQLLLDGRFRTRDEHRHFVMLSLAEAETLRRVLHARLQELKFGPVVGGFHSAPA